MQEKLPIKEKILQYLNIKGVTKYKFYKETGITRGILDQKNGITEDNLLKFINYAQDISLEWLFFESGEMLTLREFKEPIKPKTHSEEIYKQLFTEKEIEIKELNREIGRLQAVITKFRGYKMNREHNIAAENQQEYKPKEK